jgi:uncharacterized membrane protein
MTLNLSRKVLLVNILVVLLIIIITLMPDNLLRVILGLPLLLFFPGYTLAAAIFYRGESLGGIERFGMSFGISLVVTALIGLVLNYTPFGVSLYPVLVSLCLFIFITSAIAAYRRRGLSEEEKITLSFINSLKNWSRKALADRTLIAALIASMLVFIGTATYAVVTPSEESFTELYILGPDGQAKDYPRELTAGQEASVIIGVVNNEHRDSSYRLETVMDGRRLAEPTVIELRSGEKWERTIAFVPTGTGENRKVEFRLYKDTQLYRHLYLMVNIRDR